MSRMHYCMTRIMYGPPAVNVDNRESRAAKPVSGHSHLSVDTIRNGHLITRTDSVRAHGHCPNHQRRPVRDHVPPWWYMIANRPYSQ